MPNINRDYLCILDVKTGAINAPKMYFYNTDRSTSNIYVQLVVKETIVSATPIENATDFVIEAKIVKPNGFVKEITGQLVNEADAIYEFDLPEDFTDLTGINLVEFWVRARVSDREERITSASTKYTVKGSILNSIDDNIKDDNDYPIFLALMERVERLDKEVTEVSLATKALNEEAKGELAKIKADEVEIANNEAIRQAQEAAREHSEDTRGANESRRIQAEVAREQAEGTRQEQEQLRENNEITRQSNEASRETAEQTRQANENTRIANENARQEAETTRAGAEATRVTAENERIAKENLRIEAEEQRKANEIDRQRGYEVMGQEIDTMKVIVGNQNAKIDYIKENDRKQDILINGIFNSQDNKLTSTKEGNVHDLVESKPGLLYVDNITGNTMVNCNKEADKSIVLTEAINVEGTNNITLTQGVDGAQADVYVEGNTMVNVCDQEEPVAITKSYTVETGNHIALQGEYDGKCRPVVYGNTLVNALDISKPNKFYMFDGILEKNGYITINADGNYKNFFLNKDSIIVKPSTTYTFIIDIKECTLVSDGDAFLKFGNTSTTQQTTYWTESKTIIPSVGVHKIKITTRSDFNDVFLGDRAFLNLTATDGYIKFRYMILEGDYTNKPIPDYFTGMQSSFEDKVVTQEMVDSGKEIVENLGKYKVEYKVTGKNKIDINKSVSNKQNVTIDKNQVILYPNYAFDAIFSYELDIKLNENTQYTLSCNKSITDNLSYIQIECLDANNIKLSDIRNFGGSVNFLIANNTSKIKLTICNGNYIGEPVTFSNIQLEEGSTATPYEPYKEHIKTYYLNSPLLEGDTIEDNGGNVYHVHRYYGVTFDGSEDEIFDNAGNDGNTSYRQSIMFDTLKIPKSKYNKITEKSNAICDKLQNITFDDIYYDRNKGIALYGNNNSMSHIVISNGFSNTNELKAWLQQNPITVVYEIASPTREVISQNDSILQDSYVGGSLDVDTAVPIEKVKFMNAFFNTRYIYPSTDYIIQFEADNAGEITLSLGGTGTVANNQLVNKGINKFSITTGNTLSSTGLYTEGIGFNASNIVVTEATNGDFGYFKGMKSVGEQEGNKIEILSRYHYIDYNREIHSGHPAKPIWAFTANSISDYLQYFNNVSSYDACKKLFDYYYVGNGDGVWINLGSFDPYEAFEILNIRIAEGEGKLNKKQILCDPLRKVGDIADRYVLIDGKWYIERNCGKLDLSNLSWASSVLDDNNIVRFWVTINSYKPKSGSTVIYDMLPNVEYSKLELRDCEGIGIKGGSESIDIDINLSKIRNVSNNEQLLEWLSSNSPFAIYQLASPTYEPIDYNPLDIYSDTTHISINSNIPAKIKARNHGYNCMVKASTTYTATYNVDGKPQKTTIVTQATLDDATRFTGTGTLDNFLLLEGDISNPPAFFSGMRSCFDQEYDEVKGKWKVNIRVVGKNLFDGEWERGSINLNTGIPYDNNLRVRSKNFNVIIPNSYIQISGEITKNNSNAIILFDNNFNFLCRIFISSVATKKLPYNAKYFKIVMFEEDNNVIPLNCKVQVERGNTASEYEPYTYNDITIYINEPLRKGDIIRAENRKILVERHMEEIVLDGSEDENIYPIYGSIYNNKCLYGLMLSKQGIEGTNLISNTLNTANGATDYYDEGIYSLGDNMRFIMNANRLNNIYTTYKFKQWLSENPTTIQYQLASPIIEEVETDYTRLMLESYENATVYFNSHIFPTSTIRYQANVISTAEVMSINDEQDSMIIDNATQIAMITLTM